MATEPLPRRELVRAMLIAGVLVACLALFIWLLQRAAGHGTNTFDRALFNWVAMYRTPQLTNFAKDLTALGSRTLLSIATALVVALLWTSGRRLAALDTVLACSAASLVTGVAKRLIGRPRPEIADQLINTTGYSFPSGHVSGLAALLTAIALHTIETAASRTQRIILVIFHAILILGVGWSRVYLGVHYPSDVIAGLCAGIACSLAAHGLVRTHLILRRLRRRSR